MSVCLRTKWLWVPVQLQSLQYSVIFRNYSGIFWTLCNSGIFRTLLWYSESWHIQNQRHIRTLAYPKLWHIQNQRNIQDPGLFRILGYSEPEAYSEPSLTYMIEGETASGYVFASYNYFRNITFSCPLVHEISMIFLMQA